MDKKKFYIIMVVVATLFSFMFADTVTFSESSRYEASNFQGKIKVFIGLTGQFENAVGAYVVARLYYNDGSLFDTISMTTNSNGIYSGNFMDRYGNWEYCDHIEVEFRGSVYSSSYDGIERIDIYWTRSF